MIRSDRRVAAPNPLTPRTLSAAPAPQPDDATARVIERPIIIAGTARSGTTLLTTMLHAHPRLAVPPENRWLPRAYLDRARFGDLRDPDNRLKFARFVTDNPQTRFAELGIDRARTVQRIIEAAPTLGSVTAAIFAEFAQSRGKARWADKRPSYAFWVDRLLALWPTLQVVHLVRDPRACAASLIRTTWWQGGLPQAVTSWLRTERAMASFARRAQPGQYVALRYEDLLVDPAPELKRLCAALGEQFDPAMLTERVQAAADMVPTWETYHDRTRGAVDPSRIDAWRTQLTPEEIGLIEWLCGRLMRERGYLPSGLARRPSPALVAKYGFRHARSAARDARIELRDARLRRREPYPLAAVQ
jgi:hypothetical protein